MTNYEKLGEISFASQTEQLKHVRDQVRSIIEQQGCPHEYTESMILAINEACMNVIQHAYGSDKSGKIILEILQRDDQLIFRLIDFAKPVDQGSIKSRPLDEIRPGGLGVHFIREVMDSVTFVDCTGKAGNILEMKKKFTRGT